MPNQDSSTAGPARNAPPAAAAGQALREAARRLGFSACGITTADDLACGPLLEDWLEAGRHGDMAYLAEKHERRLSPALALPGARSAVVVAWSYAGGRLPVPEPQEPLRGRVAAYALGRDYHEHVAEGLERLAEVLRETTGADCSVHVDGGPLLEKELARRAGLGWYGHHTNLIHPDLGSTFVLGVLLTGAELAPDPPFASEHCGTCRACLPACPTGALDHGPTIDARLCISYLTIEHRGPVPEELRGRVGSWVFGCDACQDACPWNGDAAEAHPLQHPWLPDWLDMDEDGFRERFAGTALLRPKRRGLARNAAVALGNSGAAEAVPFLARALREHDEALVRAHAAWALGRLAGGDARHALDAAARAERVPPVRREIAAATVAAGTPTAK